MHNIVLIQEEIGYLKDTIKIIIKYKGYKRQYIQVEETLIVSKVAKLVTKKKSSYCKESKTPVKRVYIERCCS